MKNKKEDIKKLNTKIVIKNIVFLLVGIIVGTGITFILMNSGSEKKIKITKSYSNDKFAALYEAYDTIKENYYTDLDDDVLVNGAIKGMIDSIGDEHTMFLNPEEKDSFEVSLSGSYYGIGAQITNVGENLEDTVITKVFDDSPAEKVGLQEGDLFVSIDGESTKGLSVLEISSKLRSDKSKTATVVINRNGEEITFNIEKSIVILKSISSEMLDDEIGYIYIDIFGEDTDEEFGKALSDLENQGMKKLIIDLRDNSGGYLSTVTKMISRFVDTKTVIFQIKDRNKTTKYNSISDSKLDYQVIILVNENSASASEIMASALNEQYGATLVGKTTFGKGTVQQTEDLSNDSLIKYTIEEWLTSKGNSIDKVGITPDVEIDLSDEYKSSPSRENDNQLNKAIELLK